MKNLFKGMLVASALLVTAGIAQVSAATPKTVGGVVVGLNGTRTNLAFEAMEAAGSKAARGTATWVRTGDVWANEMQGKVIAAEVMGNDAEFTVLIAKSSNYPEWVGEKIKFIVHDGGTSGTEGDSVMWQWMSGPYQGGAYGEPVIAGNLQVME